MAWDRLRSAADSPEQNSQVETLVNRLPTLRQRLRSLPLSIVNPEIRPDMLWFCEDGQMLLTHWGEWSLDPVGSGWLDGLETLPQIAPALKEAALRRPNLSNVSSTVAELAALAYALEEYFQSQRFIQALRLIPLILERLTQIEEPRSEALTSP
jgi:hypothetical protein